MTQETLRAAVEALPEPTLGLKGGVSRAAVLALLATADRLDAAWAEAEAALPEGWYISNVRRRSLTGRYSASATLAGSETGVNVSGFGPSPAAALTALAARLRALRP